MRRLLMVAVLVLALVAGAWWWRGTAGPSSSPVSAPASAATAELVRQDLSTSVSLTGRLGHGTARSLKGVRGGVVTWLPAAGATVRRGEQLYRVNDAPVALFYGGIPLYRALSVPNTVGRDVRVVADNLKALGYSVGRRYGAGESVRVLEEQDANSGAAKSCGQQPKTSEPPANVTPTQCRGGGGGGTRDKSEKPEKSEARWIKIRSGEDVLTESLIRAVKRWQRGTGLPVTGGIAPGDVAILSAAIRVESLAAQLGDDAATALMSITPTTKVVTVEAEPSDAEGIKRGDQVEIRLPGDATVPGEVSQVSSALTEETPDARPKLTVTVKLNKPADLDAAPVEVTFAGETRTDVLAAPVGALLALAEGGYAVQIAGGAMVAVETGMFANGLVEVSGDGLTEGARVVTTS